MDIQRQTEMEHREVQENRGSRTSEDATEEQFLKDLYLFMRKRDTPIERIPHLGFKQIDLYVMFKTVKNFGGYHQVTAQQLWKHVYNILGGNPRSTSAATCTRRHYEKLLLPYECHIKGMRLSAVQQPRPYHYVEYRKPNEDGPPPAKRRPVLFPSQNPSEVLSEHHSRLFPVSPSYHKFYYPAYQFPPLPQSLLPEVPPPPPPPPPPPAYLSCTRPSPSSAEGPPPPPRSSDHLKDPVGHLRYLAKQYENSAGFSEPLNLSLKPSSQDIATSPASSFAPPSSHKNPKFLNKVSPLYMTGNKSVKSDAEDGVAADTSILKHSPSPNAHDEKNNKEATESPEVSCISESNGENGERRMEIEIPLSVFNNWLQMCSSRATLQSSRPLIIQEECATTSATAETMAPNMTFEIKRYEGRSGHMPGQRCTSESFPLSQYRRIDTKPTPGILRNEANKDVGLFCDVNGPYDVKSARTQGWDLTSRSAPTPLKPVDSAVGAPPAPQDLGASKSSANRERAQQRPQPEATKQNPLSTLQLTPDEVLKLKKIISNSACH